MRIQRMIIKLIKGDVLLKLFCMIADIKYKYNQYLAKVTDSKPFRLIDEYKRPIVFFLYLMWVAGCGYWVYQLMMVDAKPKDSLGLEMTDSRDALAILFFGTLFSVFVLFIAWFIIKFIYNLFHNGIESFFSVRWHSLVKPVSYLGILCLAFSFTGPIKAAGLTAYNQVAGLVHTSRRHTIVIDNETAGDIERKLSVLMKMIGKDNQE